VNQIGTSDLYRWIMRSTTDGLWVLDDAGRTTFANDRLAEILGRTAEEMVGLPATEALDDAGRQHLLDPLQSPEADGTGRHNVDCDLVREDGSRTRALVSRSPLLDDEGVRRGWLHRVTELSDCHPLLDRALTSEQQLAEAQAIARVGSWEWDVQNDVVSWSDELYRIYNLHPQEFEATYEGFLAHVHPEDRASVEAVVTSAFHESDTFKFDARIVKQGGEEGWVRGRGRVTRDASGAPVRMGGTAHEITESVMAAREITAARDSTTQASRKKVTSTVLTEPTPSLGRVLVAEDNVVNQMVARGMLEGLGYAVDFAQDGREAVQLVTSSPDRFVAVLMDCQMPRLDGFDATRAIRERERPGERIPIIAMTASALLGEQERCLAAGMDDFLVKPVGFELLESTLAKWVEGAEVPAEPVDLGDDFGGALDLARVQMLRDLRPGDRSLFEQFVDAFLAKVPEEVAAIEAAVRAGDPARLVETAHVLKGSAQNLGAAELGRTCQALENAGDHEDITEAKPLLLLLTEQVERASYAFQRLVADEQGSALNAS
jgi:PAS domain S-box-containing protein